MEKSVCGVIWEGSLAPSKTSYKELTAWNPSESRGSSSISKKRQVSLRTSRFHIGNNLFAPYLLFFLTDFSQVWYRWKAIFKGNPTLYVAKGRDCFLWKTSAITEIAPLGSSWSYLVNIQPGLILFGHFPLRLGSSYYQNPSRGRIILRNPIILSLYWSNSSEAFIYIFKSGYTLCDCLWLVAGLVPKKWTLVIRQVARQPLPRVTPEKTYIEVSYYYGQSYYPFLQYTCGWPRFAIYSHRLVVLI